VAFRGSGKVDVFRSDAEVSPREVGS